MYVYTYIYMYIYSSLLFFTFFVLSSLRVSIYVFYYLCKSYVCMPVRTSLN